MTLHEPRPSLDLVACRWAAVRAYLIRLTQDVEPAEVLRCFESVLFYARRDLPWAHVSFDRTSRSFTVRVEPTQESFCLRVDVPQEN